MSKNTGLRFNALKLGIGMLPVEWRVELARVFTMGALKYARNNWLGGMPWSTPIDCAERHWVKWLAGEVIDPETGCHHLALAAWNILSLLTYEMRGLGTDDRVTHGLKLDERFAWIDGPAAQLGLGLSEEQLRELASKYEIQRAQSAEPKKG